MDKYFQDIRENIIQNIKQGTLFHAIILEGDKESPKRQLAEEMAAILLNTNHLENNSDYQVMKTDHMNIEAMRKIIADSYIQPFRDKKLYLIEDASKMTVPMQNAFLKTLEEPPSYVVFILLCENSSTLLETIRSRCVKYFIPTEKNPVPGLDLPFQTEKIKVDGLVSVIIKREPLDIMARIEELKDKKEDLEIILTEEVNQAGMILRQQIYREKDEPKEEYTPVTLHEILSVIDILDKTRVQISNRCNVNLSLDSMMFNILEVIS